MSVAPQITNSAVTVGTSAVEIAEGGYVVVQSTTAGFHIGGPDVTTANGLYIPQNERFGFALPNGTKLYAIAVSSADVRIMRLP